MGVCYGAQARLALGQRARIAVRQEFMFAVAEWLKNGFFKKPMLDFLLSSTETTFLKCLGLVFEKIAVLCTRFTVQARGIQTNTQISIIA